MVMFSGPFKNMNASCDTSSNATIIYFGTFTLPTGPVDFRTISTSAIDLINIPHFIHKHVVPKFALNALNRTFVPSNRKDRTNGAIGKKDNQYYKKGPSGPRRAQIANALHCCRS